MSEKELIDKTNEVIAELVYDKYELQKAYNYYNGKRDPEQFKYLEENFGIGSPTSVEFTPLLKKHVDALGASPLPPPSQAAEIAFHFHHEMTLIGGNSILTLIYTSFKVPCTALWVRFCRKYGVDTLHSNIEELYRHLKNRDLVAARKWSNEYLKEAIDGNKQIYHA